MPSIRTCNDIYSLENIIIIIVISFLIRSIKGYVNVSVDHVIVGAKNLAKKGSRTASNQRFDMLT